MKQMKPYFQLNRYFNDLDNKPIITDLNSNNLINGSSF